MPNGHLPGTRPVSNNYGDDLENERPVEDPKRELDAVNWNRLKADLAYLARTGVLFAIYVTNNGVTAVPTLLLGPEGISPEDIVATRLGVGNVRVVYSAISDLGRAANGAVMHATLPGALLCTKPVSGSVDTLVAMSGPTIDADFLLLVW